MKCLVILLNHCRPDYLGCYGNDWLATGALDQLAAESLVFDRHFADYPTAAGARRGWLTGRFTGAPRGAQQLLTELWQHGVLTALLADERSPSLGSRFARDWTCQQWVRRPHLPDLEQESLLGGTVQSAIEWLGQNGKRENWLLWIEISALLPPWDSAEFDREALLTDPGEDFEPLFDPLLGPISDAAGLDRLRNTYAGIMGGVDQWLGQFLEFLRGSGLYRDVFLLVTSDIGMPLGDHGVVGEASSRLHEELVHLPLLIRAPGDQNGRRDSHLTQSVDLAPTIADIFGLTFRSTAHGQSLLPLVRGESVKIRDYACSSVRHKRQDQWSLRTNEWRLLLTAGGPSAAGEKSTAQLYVKPDDRWEVNDVCKQHPEVADHLELALRRFLAAVRADRLDELPPLTLPGQQR
jgi:arylsulfatase A-like enzyme